MVCVQHQVMKPGVVTVINFKQNIVTLNIVYANSDILSNIRRRSTNKHSVTLVLELHHILKIRSLLSHSPYDFTQLFRCCLSSHATMTTQHSFDCGAKFMNVGNDKGLHKLLDDFIGFYCSL